MQIFPFGQVVPIKILIGEIPQQLSLYQDIKVTLISEDLKLRGQRDKINFHYNDIRFSNEYQADNNGVWYGALEFNLPVEKQTLDMVYHVVVTLNDLTTETPLQFTFRNAFCLFNELQDVPHKLMLLDTTRQADYCKLKAELIVGRGKSAYDIACEEQGFKGTKLEWLQTLGQTPYESYCWWANHFGFEAFREEVFWSKLINIIHNQNS